MIIHKKNQKKYIISKNCNCVVDLNTNSFIRCGNTLSEVPSAGELEYIDMEMTNIYTETFEHQYKTKFFKKHLTFMTFKSFRNIISKLPKSLNHINLLVDPKCETNPDIWKILYYCKRIGITTSMIVDDIDFDKAKRISQYCKSVSVNLHENKNICLNTIERFIYHGVMTNLNVLVSKETHHLIVNTLYNYENDYRLKGLNSIFFVGLKKAENWQYYNKMDLQNFKRIIEHMTKRNIPFGLDPSLSSYFIEKNKNHISQYHNMLANQCESFTFYAYIDVSGWVFPCKYYIPDIQHMIGFNIFEVKSFEEMWNEKYIGKIRKMFIRKNEKGIRVCPLFEIY